MKCNISDLMVIDLYLQFFLKKLPDTGCHLIFFIKHDTDVICQRIADLLTILHTADCKIKMICHGKKYRAVYFFEFFFCPTQHFIRKLETERRNGFDDIFGVTSLRHLLQRINLCFCGNRHGLSDLFAKSHTFSHNQTFLIVFVRNSHKGIVI